MRQLKYGITHHHLHDCTVPDPCMHAATNKLMPVAAEHYTFLHRQFFAAAFAAAAAALRAR